MLSNSILVSLFYFLPIFLLILKVQFFFFFFRIDDTEIEYRSISGERVSDNLRTEMLVIRMFEKLKGDFNFLPVCRLRYFLIHARKNEI